MTHEHQVAAMLIERRMTLSTAESCTGGGLSHRLTAVPGSSGFFIGGVIAYQNDVKRDWLDVPSDVLDRHGAVSSQTANKMAEGCHRKFKTDMAVSITGIAGPGGGSIEKPVGLVFIAVTLGTATRVVAHRFSGDRASVRTQAIDAALELILQVLDDKT